MISDTWHHQQTSDSDSDDKPIFIDRSGDIFQHVLEYLRYGSVVLPISIPAEMFIRDLEYYSLEYDASTITDGEERYATLKKKYDELDEDMKRVGEILSKLMTIKQGLETLIEGNNAWAIIYYFELVLYNCKSIIICLDTFDKDNRDQQLIKPNRKALFLSAFTFFLIQNSEDISPPTNKC